jgi:Ribonuclease G/E
MKAWLDHVGDFLGRDEKAAFGGEFVDSDALAGIDPADRGRRVVRQPSVSCQLGQMLIDATHPEETRVVVVDGTKVEEFDFESLNKRQLAGNIYLAKVTRVEPSLQAAFVDYGGNRHGFLAFSEIHPDYYQIPVADREALLAEERAYAEARPPRPRKRQAKAPPFPPPQAQWAPRPRRRIPMR